MKKLATIIPVNCITHAEDGEEFSVYWNEESGNLIAIFASGKEETLDYTAKSLGEAIDTVYSLYAPSNAYIYEPEEVDL